MSIFYLGYLFLLRFENYWKQQLVSCLAVWYIEMVLFVTVDQRWLCQVWLITMLPRTWRDRLRKTKRTMTEPLAATSEPFAAQTPIPAGFNELTISLQFTWCLWLKIVVANVKPSSSVCFGAQIHENPRKPCQLSGRNACTRWTPRCPAPRRWWWLTPVTSLSADATTPWFPSSGLARRSWSQWVSQRIIYVLEPDPCVDLFMLREEYEGGRDFYHAVAVIKKGSLTNVRNLKVPKYLYFHRGKWDIYVIHGIHGIYGMYGIHM